MSQQIEKIKNLLEYGACCTIQDEVGVVTLMLYTHLSDNYYFNDNVILSVVACDCYIQYAYGYIVCITYRMGIQPCI